MAHQFIANQHEDRGASGITLEGADPRHAVGGRVQARAHGAEGDIRKQVQLQELRALRVAQCGSRGDDHALLPQDFNVRDTRGHRAGDPDQRERFLGKRGVARKHTDSHDRSA